MITCKYTKKININIALIYKFIHTKSEHHTASGNNPIKNTHMRHTPNIDYPIHSLEHPSHSISNALIIAHKKTIYEQPISMQNENLKQTTIIPKK